MATEKRMRMDEKFSKQRNANMSSHHDNEEIEKNKEDYNIIDFKKYQ